MITVIDPNNKKIYINRSPDLNADSDISNIDTYDKGGLFQSINPSPEYEKMFIFSSLKVRRRPNSVILNNPTLENIDEDLKRQILINDQINNSQPTFVSKQEEIILDLIGYEQDGTLYKDKPFTNSYTDSINGNETDINVNEFQGFGVTKIEIESEMNFINKAKVTIIDARRGANLKQSPLSLLMNTTPPPEYELKLKGYYGRMLRYLMQPINIPKVSFDSNTGAFIIEIELAAINWKPLTQIYITDLFNLPFMDSNKKNNVVIDNQQKKINLSSTEPPNSFYEFYLRAKKFYDDVVTLKESKDLTEREKELRLREAIVNKLINLSSNFGIQFSSFYKDRNLLNIEKRFSRGDKYYIINDSKNRTGLNNPNTKKIFTDFYNQKISDFGNEDIIDEISVIKDYFNDDTNFTTRTINGTTFNVLDFKNYYQSLTTYSKSLVVEFEQLNNLKRERIDSKLRERFGTNNGNTFKPTVRNIIKLIADDVDIFFNILRDTTESAEQYHKNNTTEDLIEQGNNLGGIDGIHPFPFYSEIEVDSQQTQRLVKRSPSQVENFSNWPEVKLTEDYYRASIYSVDTTNDFKEQLDNYQQDFVIIDESTEEKINNKTNNNTKFIIPKENIYYNLKLLVDTWILGYSTPDSDYSYPNNGGRALIDNMIFVDRAFNDIGDECILDFLKILDKDIRTDSVYGLILDLLESNNFKVFPLQNFMVLDRDSWIDAFEPIEEVEQLDYQPLLICMYIGDNSIQVDSNNSHKSDSFSLDNPTPEFNTTPKTNPNNVTDYGKVFAFKVGFGEQNQSYFKNITFNVDGDNLVTLEYLKIIDQISNDAGKANPILLGQSMYDVYSKISYNVTVEMLGNMMIQPTQYFSVENIPIFNGTYMITHVSHNIEGNNMTTTFKGHKVGRYIRPLVTQFAETVDIFYDSIKINLTVGENITEANENLTETLENLVRNQNADFNVNSIVTTNNNLITIDLGYKQVSVDTTISNNNLGITEIPEYTFN